MKPAGMAVMKSKARISGSLHQWRNETDEARACIAQALNAPSWPTIRRGVLAPEHQKPKSISAHAFLGAGGEATRILAARCW